jgi:integrase
LPITHAKVIPELSTDQIQALLKVCQGRGFRERRDEAIVRLMLETMARAGEVVAMQVSDVDLRDGSAIIRRGKGGKGRRVPFGPQTGRSIDRYLRLRREHKRPHGGAMARRPQPRVQLRRAVQHSRAPRRCGRYRGFPPAHAAAHRRESVVGRRG